jgi:hypothetical protein
MWLRVAVIKSDVSAELIAFIITMERINELGRTLSVTTIVIVFVVTAVKTSNPTWFSSRFHCIGHRSVSLPMLAILRAFVAH